MARAGIIDRNQDSKGLLIFFATIIILSAFAATLLDQIVLLALPAVIFFLFIAIVDFKWIYLGMFALIPLSIEYETPIGFATDLPVEPVMIFSTGLYLLILLSSIKNIKSDVFRHPISILIYSHLSWILFTAFTSTFPIISLKFLMAKLWYVFAFFFLSMYMLNDIKKVKLLFWFISIPLSLATLWVIYNHSLEGFSFKSANFVMKPFFRNHVNYACILSLFVPFLFFMRKQYKKRQLIAISDHRYAVGLFDWHLFFLYEDCPDFPLYCGSFLLDNKV